jgi:chitodextrinase
MVGQKGVTRVRVETSGYKPAYVYVGVSDGEQHGWGRLSLASALREAIAFVCGLPDAKPKLPEPEEMSRCKLMEELAERGACAKAIDSKWWTVHLSDGTDTRLCTDNDQGLRDALRRARELDGD